MSDILTQLQDAIDILVQQMYAGLMYTNTRHPYGSIPAQPHDASRDIGNPAAAAAENGGPSITGNDNRPRTPPPDPSFAVTQHEIASDIILNMARINALADRLPGIGFSEQQQLARLAELDRELREEQERLEKARVEKERLLGLLDERIMKARRP
ncbi:mediator-rna polymerase ii transcription subunit 21 [Diplodia corticola]|uniref:Mediator of RNA polymerase II transcription subunit 21 n=1 Tax=Diplodia corticola TaxID=236234 RepID=A0A1J9RXE7_9PEZI|nr:mediator-rna polymerase ii transcription subunit 21 [Diplodia corticola]OJD32157.1 mediator-rna polymerase ii transcription subunit 21 [Diplodia corticola]